MKLGGLGLPELIIILAVALLIFGPKNLPKLGSALGRTVKNLREGMSGEEKEEEAEEEIEEQPRKKKKKAQTADEGDTDEA